jgi:hypothetical protein
MAASVDRPGYSERRRNPAPEEALRSADARLGFEPATDPTNSRPECRMAAGSHPRGTSRLPRIRRSRPTAAGGEEMWGQFPLS